VRVDLERFVREVPLPIQSLSLVLNRHKVTCLRDLPCLDELGIAKVLAAISASVCAISRIKPTIAVSPMFGSKVVHHYFPSLVPVFDDAKIRRYLMKGRTFTAFEANHTQPWLTRASVLDAAEPAMRDYHHYLAFCAWQIETAGTADLIWARTILGEKCEKFASKSLQTDPNSLLWKLDAKVAEFCSCGAVR
jgi:hypothetical protein